MKVLEWSELEQEECFEMFRRVVVERDEFVRQLEDARRLACHYAELLHMAHDSRGIIEPDWKAS